MEEERKKEVAMMDKDWRLATPGEIWMDKDLQLAIVTAFCEGNDTAWEQLKAAYQPYIVGCVCNAFRNQLDRETVFNAIDDKLLKYVGQYVIDHRAKHSTLMRKYVASSIADQMRRIGSRKKALEKLILKQKQQEGAAAELGLVREYRDLLVREAYNLNGEKRNLVLMRLEQDKRFSEIGRILRKKEAAVRKAYGRAIVMLRERIDDRPGRKASRAVKSGAIAGICR